MRPGPLAKVSTSLILWILMLICDVQRYSHPLHGHYVPECQKYIPESNPWRIQLIQCAGKTKSLKTFVMAGTPVASTRLRNHCSESDRKTPDQVMRPDPLAKVSTSLMLICDVQRYSGCCLKPSVAVTRCYCCSTPADTRTHLPCIFCCPTAYIHTQRSLYIIPNCSAAQLSVQAGPTNSSPMLALATVQSTLPRPSTDTALSAWFGNASLL